MQKIKYSGNAKNFSLSYEDEEQIKELLMYRKIVKVENDTFYLDNGVTLEVIPNEGCGGCSNGWFDIEEINGCDNAITNVEFDEEYDKYNDDLDHFNIFVYAENKKIKILDVSGKDNGYYGVGYTLNVRIPRELEYDKSSEDFER